VPRPPREFPCICPRCGELKPESAYSWKIQALGQRQVYCRPCFRVNQRESRRRHAHKYNARRRAQYTPEQGRRDNLRRFYGITPEQFDALQEAQGGGCAVCGETRVWRGRRRLHVDHDHETGRIRGLLCHACNVCLGALEEDIERIRGLARYLEGSNHATLARILYEEESS
jgi:hypothetical protein